MPWSPQQEKFLQQMRPPELQGGELKQAEYVRLQTMVNWQSYPGMENHMKAYSDRIKRAPDKESDSFLCS